MSDKPIWCPQHEAHLENPPRCFRVGGEVTLENGKCPECGWKDKPVASAPIDEVRKRLREWSNDRNARFDPRLDLDALLADHERLQREVDLAKTALEKSEARAAAMRSAIQAYFDSDDEDRVTEHSMMQAALASDAGKDCLGPEARERVAELVRGAAGTITEHQVGQPWARGRLNEALKLLEGE